MESYPTEISYSDNNVSLILRSLIEEDAEKIHVAVLNSLDILLPFMPWSHHSLTLENQIKRIKESQNNSTEWELSVLDKPTGEFLMSACLRKASIISENLYEIGYWVAKKHGNKGLATLVTKILSVVAFEFLGCDCLQVGCNKSNQISQKVMNKCGFKLEGEIRNYFSIPTQKMVENGYTAERTCLRYSLIQEDLLHLKWYQEIKHAIKIKKNCTQRSIRQGISS